MNIFIKKISTDVNNIRMKKGIKNTHFSEAMHRMAKNEVEYNEKVTYKIIEVKTEEQNMATNFQLLSFELLWNNVLRGVNDVIK